MSEINLVIGVPVNGFADHANFDEVKIVVAVTTGQEAPIDYNYWTRQYSWE